MDKSSLVTKELCNNADVKKSWNGHLTIFWDKIAFGKSKEISQQNSIRWFSKKKSFSYLIVSNWRRPEVVKKAFEIFFITSSGKAKFLQWSSGKIDSFLEWIFWSWRIVLSSHVIPFPHFHQYLAKNLRAFTIEASKNRKQTSKVFFPTLKSARSLTSKRPHQIMRIFGNPRFLSKNH